MPADKSAAGAAILNTVTLCAMPLQKLFLKVVSRSSMEFKRRVSKFCAKAHNEINEHKQLSISRVLNRMVVFFIDTQDNCYGWARKGGFKLI